MGSSPAVRLVAVAPLVGGSGRPQRQHDEARGGRGGQGTQRRRRWHEVAAARRGGDGSGPRQCGAGRGAGSRQVETGRPGAGRSAGPRRLRLEGAAAARHTWDASLMWSARRSRIGAAGLEQSDWSSRTGAACSLQSQGSQQPADRPLDIYGLLLLFSCRVVNFGIPGGHPPDTSP